MDVVAAIIQRGDGLLITRRPAGKRRGLLWEFPGGKVEPGEPHAQALRRECREELGVDIRVGRLFMQVRHEYPDIAVDLFLYTAALTDAGQQPRALEGQALRWVIASELPAFDFCPADEAILARLQSEHGRYVDLHLHSRHSDGTLTPGAIVAQARRLGIGTLALTDHNSLDGLGEVRDACREAGIRMIAGVELNADDGGRDVHVLGYGFDEGDAAFAAMVADSRARLDSLSDRLIARMAEDGQPVSPADYAAFTADPDKGGWKALQYLLSRGTGAGIREVLALYARYACSYDSAGFPGVRVVARAIHAAGGRAVLAHPEETLGHVDQGELREWLARMIACGLDGVECYHPGQSQRSIQACEDFCRARGLLITAGSDAHGAFGRGVMGEMRAVPEGLALDGLRFG